MVDNSVVNAVKKYLTLLQQQGIPVQFGVIFGSQITGDIHEWSDIDLLIVSPKFDGVRNRQDIDLLWNLTLKSDNRIEPIACGERQWSEDDSSAIIEIARRQGEIVNCYHNP